ASQGAGDDVYFRYTFNLASSDDPNTFNLTMRLYADNRVWEIYVNDIPQSTQPNRIPILPQFQSAPATDETYGFQAGNEVVITLDNSWKRCQNELVVHVKSPGGVMGFLAQNALKVDSTDTGCDCDCDCTEAEFPDIQPC